MCQLVNGPAVCNSANCNESQLNDPGAAALANTANRERGAAAAANSVCCLRTIISGSNKGALNDSQALYHAGRAAAGKDVALTPLSLSLFLAGTVLIERQVAVYFKEKTRLADARSENNTRKRRKKRDR